jgi:hypothetical protein
MRIESAKPRLFGEEFAFQLLGCADALVLENPIVHVLAHGISIAPGNILAVLSEAWNSLARIVAYFAFCIVRATVSARAARFVHNVEATTGSASSLRIQVVKGA